MINTNLALLGGPKTIETPFESYNSIGQEEVEAAKKVVESGVLSNFVGDWDSDFYGGSFVKKFESECEKKFNVKHAVTVNSWTSGLICAVGAIGIEPGDEIIVTPWTMCASASAILHWNAIPVFADIDPLTFNIDPSSVIKNITPQTRAIMAVDIFGQSCDIDKLMDIAKDHKLKVITDSAQSPGVFNNNRVTGTLGDIGGFSLNYHKHIHTGEGGILVTNDDEMHERLQLIRNHAEAVVGPKKVKNITNMLGHNFRLGEIESAIGIEQLKKLEKLVSSRQKIANYFTKNLSDLTGIITPTIFKNNTHAYYTYPIILDIEKLKVPREVITKALIAEGLTGLVNGYQNIHLLPMYQEKKCYGSKGFPWTSDICKRDVNYKKGICPIAENLHDKTFLNYFMCTHQLNEKDTELIVECFKKVWRNMDKLR